jgi:hypothetical protein
MPTATDRLPYASRLVLNRCGCGFEAASVAIGTDPAEPDETYGSKCWADPGRWNSPRPPHTHLDGRECGQECAN